MFQNRFSQIKQKHDTIHPEDDIAMEQCWKEMTDLLSENLDVTLQFMQSCNEGDAEMISEVMDDVSNRLRSRSFIEALKQMNARLPNLNIGNLIESDEKMFLE